jgi:hypothetical protein
MKNYLFLPVALLKFWYIESPLALLGFFKSINQAFFQLFSLPLFLKTYFKPLKNEYREGLVGFSIAMGVIVKTFLILADTFMLLVILFFEISIFVSFLAFPIATILVLFL